VERELSTLPEHLSSPPVFCGVRSFMCMFCRSFIVLFLFGIVFFFDLWILITPLVSSNSSSYMYEPYDENTLWRLLRVSISRLLLRFSLTNSNITSLFRFVTKRTIYRLGIISLAHAPVHVTDFPVVNVHFDELSSARIWQHKLCATLSANVNMNYRLPIKVLLPYLYS
jgi:hypothetical protein